MHAAWLSGGCEDCQGCTIHYAGCLVVVVVVMVVQHIMLVVCMVVVVVVANSCTIHYAA